MGQVNSDIATAMIDSGGFFILKRQRVDGKLKYIECEISDTDKTGSCCNNVPVDFYLIAKSVRYNMVTTPNFLMPLFVYQYGTPYTPQPNIEWSQIKGTL